MTAKREQQPKKYVQYTYIIHIYVHIYIHILYIYIHILHILYIYIYYILYNNLFMNEQN